MLASDLSSRCISGRVLGRHWKRRCCSRKDRGLLLVVFQRQFPPRRRRVARFLLNGPREFEKYFRDRPVRRWSWRFLFTGFGFLCGNTVTLTFGTLAVNDVVAAVITVIFYSIVSRLYWSHPNPPFRLELLNWFKNGVVAGLVADSFKLGG